MDIASPSFLDDTLSFPLNHQHTYITVIYSDCLVIDTNTHSIKTSSLGSPPAVVSITTEIKVVKIYVKKSEDGWKLVQMCNRKKEQVTIYGMDVWLASCFLCLADLRLASERRGLNGYAISFIQASIALFYRNIFKRLELESSLVKDAIASIVCA